MRYNTRYWFAKKIYPNYLILFQTNKNKLGYKCYGIDKYIINGIRNYTTNINVIYRKLEKMEINYLCINTNTEITHIFETDNNNYTRYLHRYIVLDVLDTIRVGVFS